MHCLYQQTGKEDEIIAANIAKVDKNIVRLEYDKGGGVGLPESAGKAQ
jgi:hypothetical protein